MMGKKMGGKPTNRASFGLAPSSRSRFTCAASFRRMALNKGVGGVKSGSCAYRPKAPPIASAQSRVVFIVVLHSISVRGNRNSSDQRLLVPIQIIEQLV